MKHLFWLLIFSLPAFAEPALDDLSKDDVENVSKEISVNFSHTAVAAPSTNGLWGVEVGLIGGRTRSSDLADLVDDAGEDGSDFKNIPHAGFMLRGHIPGDVFAEVTFIPSIESNDTELSNRTFAVGWNFGGFFNWPIDVAIGYQLANSKFSFDQTLNNASTGNTNVDSTVDFETKSQSVWIGVSKTFFIVTPYLKVGTFKSETDVEIDAAGGGDIFAYQSSQKESVSTTGGFGALGVNVDLLIIRLGLEASRAAEVGRLSAKLSLSF